jgi:hypothetical protein
MAEDAQPASLPDFFESPQTGGIRVAVDTCRQVGEFLGDRGHFGPVGVGVE